MTDSRPLLAASLIVRDEEANLVDCLASLGGAVDEIVVHDTGSRDATRKIARRAGVRLVEGSWTGDFSAARNVALDAVTARWVLSLDADERLVADPHALRRLLLGIVPHDPPLELVGAFLLPVVHLGQDGAQQVTQFTSKIFRADGARWQGRVHEIVVLSDPVLLRCPMPASIAFVEHRGYVDAATVAAKARRNLELAQAELADLVRAGVEQGDDVERVLYDLARSFLGAGRTQDAVEALVALQRLAPDNRYGALAAALLAQTLLDAGGFGDLALHLAEELSHSEFADPRQARWLRAQSLAQLGRGEEAAELLEGIDAMLDPAGLPLSAIPVQRLREQLAGRE